MQKILTFIFLVFFSLIMMLGFLGCETEETILPRNDIFVKLYGKNGSQFGVDIKQLSNKDLIILARAEKPLNADYLLIRVDTFGNEIWYKEIRDNNELSSEVPVALTLDWNEDIIITGNYSAGTSVNDVFVYKISAATGDIITNAVFDIEDSGSGNRLDFAQDIIVFENNSYVISGYSRARPNDPDEFFSLRMDGQLIPSNSFNVVHPYLAQSSDGNVFNRRMNKILPFGDSKIIAFVTSDRNAGSEAGVPAGDNIETIIIDNEGQPDFSNNQQTLYSGTELNDYLGSAINVGTGYGFVGTSTGTTKSSLILGHVTSNGSTIRNEILLTERNLTAVSINKIQNARLIILGEERVSSGNTNIYMCEVDDTTGELFWEYAYGGEEVDEAAELLIDGNSIYVLGSLKLGEQNKVLLIKTDRSGKL